MCVCMHAIKLLIDLLPKAQVLFIWKVLAGEAFVDYSIFGKKQHVSIDKL